MASRRSNPRDSDRVQTRTGSANTERIRSGDVSEALTEEGRNRPPKKAKTNGSDHRLGVSGEAAVAKPFHWKFSRSKDCPITKNSDSVAHLAMEANNDFAATLEKCLQDVPRSDELYEIKKVIRELKLGLKIAQDRERANVAQLAAAEKLGNQAASLEARLRVVSNERKSALDYLDVLVSMKEKWETKKATTDCEACLREVMANIDLLKEIMNNNLLASDDLLRLRTKEVEFGSELYVMAVSDFSVEKLDLPQISEDLPEDFFAKVPSAVDDVTKCSGGQFEDGEFGIGE
ncbi:hypothetical protein F2Q69_00042355 [Brassica cretica]|uniref:Uncharacterized protein n=1 Tax=Brassica cretica TaxID=69181 RepID=A0A8S9NF90_BRACR|nr:hypothetical protein F2Q69_00042355 [Brassica cretica]